MSAEAMEEYYDEINFKDWTHKISKTPMLKAQHPGYELFTTGIHARSGVSCADCHMPSKSKDGKTYSDHNLRSPLNDIADTCLNCHEQSEEEFRAVVEENCSAKNS